MTFRFKCEKCGKEIEVALKIMIASKIVELPRNIKAAPITFQCPSCGQTGTVLIHLESQAFDRLTRLKFKNARHPSMN